MDVTVLKTRDKIDAKSVMRAYQRIVDHGTRDGDAFVLFGLEVRVDFDGYGLTLTDRTVTVRLLFHNNLHIDAPNRIALERFREKLEAIRCIKPSLT